MLQHVFSLASVPVASLLFKRTGAQFFLAEADEAAQSVQGVPRSALLEARAGLSRCGSGCPRDAKMLPRQSCRSQLVPVQ